MDAYDCEQTDKQMGRKVDAIYSDPTRHKFLSCYDAYIIYEKLDPTEVDPLPSPLLCYYCGMLQQGHAERDEQV